MGTSWEVSHTKQSFSKALTQEQRKTAFDSQPYQQCGEERPANPRADINSIEQHGIFSSETGVPHVSQEKLGQTALDPGMAFK